MFELFVVWAPAIAAPIPPRSPTSTTCAFASLAIWRRSAESVLVSLPLIGNVEPLGSVRRSNTTSITPDCCRVAGVASVTEPRILLPAGMTAYSLTPTLSSTFVSNVSPVLAVADCSGVVVRTMMTVPAGTTMRDCAAAVDAASNASAMLVSVLRPFSSGSEFISTS